MIRISPPCLGAALFLVTASVIPLTPSLHAETELIANDKFSDGGGSWTLLTAPGASASLSVEQDEGEAALSVVVQNDDTKPVDVRIQRVFGDIEAGKEYTATFKAKCANAAEVVAYIYPENEGSRVLWRVPIKPQPEWQEYTFTFKGKDTASNCVFGFSRMGSNNNTYSFKDIVLKAND